MRPLPAVRRRAERGQDAGGHIYVPSIPTTSWSTWQIWEWFHEELDISESHLRRPAHNPVHHRRRVRGGGRGVRNAGGGGTTQTDPSVWIEGGPFFKWSAKVDHRGEMDLKFVRWGNPTETHLKGVDPVSGYWWGQVPPVSDIRPRWLDEKLQLIAWGPAAYRATRPGNPNVDFGQWLGELRDIPRVPFKSLVSWPKIRSLAGVPFSRWGIALRNRLRDFLHIERELGTKKFIQAVKRGFRPGGEYLNVVFGWQPFVRDLQSAFELTLNLKDQLDKLIRENGKGIHRRATLSRKSTAEDLSYGVREPFSLVGGGSLAPGGYGVEGRTHHSASRVKEERVWFSGKYRYWIPDVESPLWRARAVAALYGALPTPSLLWELLPMSWFSDWFTNFGDVISNVSTNAVDNLVLEYGFVMRTYTDTIRARAHVVLEPSNLPGYHEWPRVDHVFESEYKFESKSRLEAYPFFPGSQAWVFDNTSSELPFTKRQWGILAALGLSQVFNR